jgi:hypothetical protein
VVSRSSFRKYFLFVYRAQMSSTRSCVTPAQAFSLIPHTPVLLRHRARIVTTNGQQHVNSAAFCLDWQFMRMIVRLGEYRFATSMLCLGVSDVKPPGGMGLCIPRFVSWRARVV